MERVNAIIKHSLYQACIEQIEAAEKERFFCRHNMSHFLDVARLAMIIKAKKNLIIEEELIYAAALLHDIGRHIQYSEGIPHEKASAQIAPQILKDCGFHEAERNNIVTAILQHRDINSKGKGNLCGLLYDADKMSRPCFCCGAQKACDWGKKKNMKIQY